MDIESSPPPAPLPARTEALESGQQAETPVSNRSKRLRIATNRYTPPPPEAESRSRESKAKTHPQPSIAKTPPPPSKAKTRDPQPRRAKQNDLEKRLVQIAAEAMETTEKGNGDMQELMQCLTACDETMLDIKQKFNVPLSECFLCSVSGFTPEKDEAIKKGIFSDSVIDAYGAALGIYGNSNFENPVLYLPMAFGERIMKGEENPVDIINYITTGVGGSNVFVILSVIQIGDRHILICAELVGEDRSIFIFDGSISTNSDVMTIEHHYGCLFKNAFGNHTWRFILVDPTDFPPNPKISTRNSSVFCCAMMDIFARDETDKVFNALTNKMMPKVRNLIIAFLHGLTHP